MNIAMIALVVAATIISVTIAVVAMLRAEKPDDERWLGI